MKSKDRKEFEAITSTEERAKWLIRKGVKARIVILPDANKVCYAAFSAGAKLPGDFGSKEEAITGGMKFLSDLAGTSKKKKPKHIK